MGSRNLSFNFFDISVESRANHTQSKADLDLLDVGWKSCCDDAPFMAALCPMAREATWLAAALEVAAAAV